MPDFAISTAALVAHCRATYALIADVQSLRDEALRNPATRHLGHALDLSLARNFPELPLPQPTIKRVA